MTVLTYVYVLSKKALVKFKQARILTWLESIESVVNSNELIKHCLFTKHGQ